MLAEALLDGEAEAITHKLIEKALQGDPAALRLSLERLIPPRRERHISVDLQGDIKTPADALRASNAVLSACSNGEISSEEALQMMNLITCHVRVLDAAETESRLTALERGVRK